jgi:hypothetical protein
LEPDVRQFLSLEAEVEDDSDGEEENEDDLGSVSPSTCSKSDID